jgi:hypothetical protein
VVVAVNVLTVRIIERLHLVCTVDVSSFPDGSDGSSLSKSRDVGRAQPAHFTGTQSVSSTRVARQAPVALLIRGRRSDSPSAHSEPGMRSIDPPPGDSDAQYVNEVVCKAQLHALLRRVEVSGSDHPRQDVRIVTTLYAALVRRERLRNEGGIGLGSTLVRLRALRSC